MNPLTSAAHQWSQPPAVSTFQDFLLAVAWMVMPWIVLLWLAGILIHAMFPQTRAKYGADAAVRFAYGWAGFWTGAVLLVDVIVLVILARLPGWTAVTPHALLIVIGLLMAFLSWLSLRTDLRTAQVPLRTAQQGARS